MSDSMIDHTQHDWYKDAVFYEVHVRAFHDSNADGIGDFAGLAQKLDYIKELGVTCIWLLPFYASPLDDDGYDIADYYKIHPDYGTVEDFENFLDEAHARGLRVIADLVVNHTSIEHEWFQKSRDPQSPFHDYYVWSDDPSRYTDARIIFLDTEVSNWTYDHKAKKHYWHRFFAHQADLNYDNPKVQEEMFRVVDFWLSKGLDGFRVDAVPYLFEREGTNCENLPETHEFCKRLRAHVDERFPGRVLLAEANQWPADVVEYFGDNDEFHMCFNFPIMPRMFMAIRREDRQPVEDIIVNLPEIPQDCQWATFLRNHDELSLEMVTADERDYMWNEYAKDPRMKLNLGIRRRLFPLMENNRRAVELLHSLLLTLPGSPILYYGDEIGMGDNIYLSDRFGCRTPMQWNDDRNAGFSRSDPSKLYFPVITDPIYSYEGVNVEAASRQPSSFLNWIRRLIRIRRQYSAFARGDIHFLHPQNNHVVSYLCVHNDQVMLVVNNLSRYSQFVELDLRKFDGYQPIDCFSQNPFPKIGELPYLLTMGPYGFYWFELTQP
ncbi:MAG TPA: maltose alpha-D-glucosyltransferase [Acidobacteriota bacterium]|nr:maltose alpha-D-glucosyltransferase [Acidobacteriota bacterium]